MAGEVDVATAPALEEALLGSLVGTVRRLVVDLAATTFFDSRGLAALMRASRVARERDIEFVLQAPTRNVRKILEVSGAARRFAITDCR